MKKINSFFARDGKNKNDFTRSVVLDLTRADKEKRQIPVTISTETPVRTYRGMEVLKHDKDSVDLVRAKANGIPLLYNHYGEALGRVTQVELIDRKLVGNLVFSRSQRGQDAYNDVVDGIITDISVGGQRLERSELKEGQYIVTKWKPLEASLTAVGADPKAGINRNKGDDMTPGELEALRKKEREAGAKAERLRRSAIADIFIRHGKIDGVDTVKDACLDDEKCTIDIARAKLLDHIGQGQDPIKQGENHGFELGKDETDKFKEGVTRALSVRVGCATDEDKKDIGSNPFASFSPVEIARHYLKINGVSDVGLTRHQILGESFITRGGGHTSSDFPNILADVANKSMLKGYNEIPETWSMWAQVGNLNDFKEAKRVNLSEFSEISEVPEGGEYEHGTMSDIQETIILLTYGKLFTISRQALINDDLSAMGRIPMEMGRSAQRKVGDLAYFPLTNNPAMKQDGILLFHNNHNNDFDTTAPTVEALDEMRVAMALQKGILEESTLGITPANILVPMELEGLTRTLVKAQYDPSTDAGTLTPNPEQGRLQVVAEHRLSLDSPTTWYLSASSSMVDTVEVAFLDGNRSPFLEQQDGFTRDGVTHKVRIDAGVAPLDFRGLSRNLGSND